MENSTTKPGYQGLTRVIKAAVDRVGDEPHQLSGRAKDLGSAAVFMALILAGVL